MKTRSYTCGHHTRTDEPFDASETVGTPCPACEPLPKVWWMTDDRIVSKLWTGVLCFPGSPYAPRPIFPPMAASAIEGFRQRLLGGRRTQNPHKSLGGMNVYWRGWTDGWTLANSMMPIDPYAVDQAIEEGLVCPKCGSQDLGTYQSVLHFQPVTKGEWGGSEYMGDASSTTLAVHCLDCSQHIWGKDDLL